MRSAVALAALLSSLLSPAAPEPYDALYSDAVDAFHGGDYRRVVRLMEEALRGAAELRRARIRCRLACEDQHRFRGPASEPQLCDTVLRRAACLRGCLERSVGAQSLHKVSEEVAQDFQRRVPYNYLQMAYYQLKEVDKAASAAHTYFQANPEHVEQYKSTEGLEQLVDREARPHQRAFSEAVKMYDQGRYEEAAGLFEEALSEYYRADVECRVLCEGPQRFEEQDHVLYRHSLYELISDHFTQVLHCQHECVRDLATRPGRLSPMENFLPLHYDYLQFAYFQVNAVQEALACAHTYLLFHKAAEFMMENVAYYTDVLGHDGEPREEAERYLRRHKQESELLVLGSQNMGVDYAEGNYWSSSGGREDASRIPSGTDGWLEYVPISEKRNATAAAAPELREGGPLPYEQVMVALDSEALNGTQRVLLDHVISEDECTELKNMAHAVTMAGDGYRGKMSPHTPNERFEGATVLRTLQYGYEGRVPLRSARLFYDVSEKARRIVESYFMLNSTLHFSYTHLVCRTAIQGQQDHRNDLSHPIHADNCLLDPDANECWREAPAYTYRDYSALLYLNGDFEGGEFIFTEMDAKTVTAAVKPKCGRMVGFSSGGENPHGVRAVTSGQRCAVALWFTLDPLFRELERLQADEVMEALDGHQQREHGLHINPKDEL
ncbi:prolyl 3-hydroxylase 2 [Denticeps clupeoides]|uniref:prolyl 3-hydroxylase 2 n=1 Tax=Denticeps clupeoides TaxID=299321 RepID=UPI0010A3FD50|nr:prolyl 3-hydroxylase 2 [Denticeps clupeoides]